MRRFVSDASHELRTPLATVRGYAELYRIGGVPADQVAHAFERVESEASRMAHLVEDLLQLARLDEGRQLRFTQVELVSTAMNAVADFLVRSPNSPAAVISLSGHELEPIVINADQDRITQLITNLLTNVITHTPEGTAVEVAIGIKDQDGNDLAPHANLTQLQNGVAVIEVRDHGPGIKDDDSERIFERFYRADASRSRDSGGSGLGLAIVAAICAAHGGSAKILHTPGGGLTVQLRFPSLLLKATTKARCIAESEGTIPTHLPSQVQATITGDYTVE
ncbi:sensor histidine kinase [Arcanobacterium hippocoleae]